MGYSRIIHIPHPPTGWQVGNPGGGGGGGLTPWKSRWEGEPKKFGNPGGREGGQKMLPSVGGGGGHGFFLE